MAVKTEDGILRMVRAYWRDSATVRVEIVTDRFGGKALRSNLVNGMPPTQARPIHCPEPASLPKVEPKKPRAGSVLVG